MTKKLGLVTTFAAFAMAACTFATLGMAKGMASAAEVEPTPAEQGWYIVGNGMGSLKDCSWNDYVPAFKLDGRESKTGRFTFEGLELYAGDAFKILYADGEWAYPSESGWTADVMVQYSNLDSYAAGYFVDGGLGNIQATPAGQGRYDLTLTVTADTISLSYDRTGDIIDPTVTEEMYVVGSLANYETCNWPGSIDVKTSCPGMKYDTATKTWSVTLNLVEGDEFKIYNLVNNAYYPSGMNNNYVVEETGTYLIAWQSTAPDFTVTPVKA
ncbi:MAG: hypothetical protein K2H43_02055 [Clostridia bacterium]|nr:hypothetical protein [Clostridia bacterium]